MNIQNFEEKKVVSELIYDGKIVHLFRDTVRLPNGKEAFREIIRHNGAVCVVPLTQEEDVLCVWQYRYVHHKMLLEIPAGKLESKSENREEAALRELREETGAHCERLTCLGDFLSSAAVIDEVITMYLAEGLTFGATDFDEDENLVSEKIPLKTLVQKILRGEVTDSKTQAAVLKVWLIKHPGEDPFAPA